MRKIVLLLTGLTITAICFSQKRVNWTFHAKKIANNTYEIHMTAELDPGWYIYAQQQPESSVAQPTQITFSKSPLLRLNGAVQEKGKPELKTYGEANVESLTYKKKVDFVQTVVLTKEVKTNIQGTILYQVCNEEMCLPPKSDIFDLSLN